MLEDGKRDSAAEFAWAMLAMATGALPGAGPDLIATFTGQLVKPLDGPHMIQVLMLAGSACAGVVAWIIVITRKKKSEDLATTIRARKT